MNPQKRATRKNLNDLKLLEVIRALIATLKTKGVHEVFVKEKSGLKPRTYATAIKRLIASKDIIRRNRPKVGYYIYINDITPIQLQTLSQTPSKTPVFDDHHMYINKKRKKEKETEVDEATESQATFEEFLEAMPRRTDGLAYLADAERIWNRMVDAGEDLQTVIAGARAYATSVPEVCTFALTPLRFLKSKVFRDYTRRPTAASAPLGVAGDGGGGGAPLEDLWNVVVRELIDYAGDVTVLLKAEIQLEKQNGSFVKVFLTFEKDDNELTYRELREVRDNLPQIRRLLSKHLGAEVRSVKVIAPDLTSDDLKTIWEMVVKKMAEKTYYGDLAKLSSLRLTVAGEVAHLTAPGHVSLGDMQDIKKHTTSLRQLIKLVAGVDVRNLIIT